MADRADGAVRSGGMRDAGGRGGGRGVLRMGGSVMGERTSRAMSYINRVRERRKGEIVRVMAAAEACMLACAALLAEAVWFG